MRWPIACLDFVTYDLNLAFDGTRNAKLVTQFEDGKLSNVKTSTLLSDNWTSSQMLYAIKQAVDLPDVAKRSDGSALYQSKVIGVKIEVIKIGNKVTVAYPCGCGFTTPQKFIDQ